MREIQKLYQDHTAELYRFAYIKLQNKEQAEDMLSESFKNKNIHLYKLGN